MTKQAMIRLRFASVSGPFTVHPHGTLYQTHAAALAAVVAYATAHGYSNVKPLEDSDAIRYTARTPGGRGGRNIAFANYEYDDADRTGWEGARS